MMIYVYVYVLHLEGDLISVWHFRVGQNCNHPLLVIDRLGWWHRESQSLMFQQVAANFNFNFASLQNWSFFISHQVQLTLYACSSQ